MEMDNLINNFNVYRRIAINGMESYLECEEKKKICNSICMGDDGIQFGYELNTKMYEFAVQAIIFSALSLEAFANDFLVMNLGKSEFELLDKLDIKAKILIGTKMITKKSFSKEKDAYQKMLNLIRLRNKLVHAKSINTDSEAAEIYIKIAKEDIENAILTYKLVIEEIDSLAPYLKIKEEYLLPDEQLRSWYYIHA